MEVWYHKYLPAIRLIARKTGSKWGNQTAVCLREKKTSQTIIKTIII